MWDDGTNIGINTSAAAEATNKLTVKQSADTNPISSGSGTYGFGLRNQANLDLTIGSDVNNIYLQTWNTKKLMINGQGNDTLINPVSGNVGIGTTTPGSKLTVVGTTNQTSTLVNVSQNYAAGTTGPLNMFNVSMTGSNGYVGPVTTATFSNTVNSTNSGTTNTALIASSTATNTGINIGGAFSANGGTAGNYAISATSGKIKVADLVSGSAGDYSVIYADENGVLSDTGVSSGDQCLHSNSGSAPTWGSCGSAGGVALSAITAATAGNNINNVGNVQQWRWDSLTVNGLYLSSTSTLANTPAGDTQKLFQISLSGANAVAGETTYASYVENNHSGTTSSNVAGYFSATNGTNNYALITGTGRAGFGVSTPISNVDINGSSATGTQALRIRGGDAGATIPADAYQILLSYNGGSLYTHNIRTRHDSTINANNAIDFYTWQVSDTSAVIGSKLSLSINDGSLVVPNTTAASGTATGGVMFKGTNTTANRFLHNYGTDNTFLGLGSGNFTTSGTGRNTGVGVSTVDAISTGWSNTAVGYSALSAVVTGNENTAVGSNSLLVATGTNNTAVGSLSLWNTTTGTDNTAVGRNTLANNITGSYNTAVGDNSGPSTSALSNTTALGYSAQATQSNMVRVGDSNVTLIQGQVNFSAGSDRRFKKNVIDLDLGLDFIKKLRPVSYKLKTEGDNEGVSYGFIAQEVEQALVGKDTKLIETDTGGMKYMRYTDLIAPTVKAIQEQQAQIEDLRKELEALKAQINTDAKTNIQSKANTTSVSTWIGIPLKSAANNFELTAAAINSL